MESLLSRVATKPCIKGQPAIKSLCSRVAGAEKWHHLQASRTQKDPTHVQPLSPVHLPPPPAFNPSPPLALLSQGRRSPGGLREARGAGRAVARRVGGPKGGGRRVGAQTQKKWRRFVEGPTFRAFFVLPSLTMATTHFGNDPLWPQRSGQPRTQQTQWEKEESRHRKTQ